MLTKKKMKNVPDRNISKGSFVHFVQLKIRFSSLYWWSFIQGKQLYVQSGIIGRSDAVTRTCC